MFRAQHYIDGRWTCGTGPELIKLSPTHGQTLWRGASASTAEIELAIHAARKAQHGWARQPIATRIAALEAFAGELHRQKSVIAEVVSLETGKPNWEALAEVEAMIRKVPLSLAAQKDRRTPIVQAGAPENAATRYKPHGVVAVFGPFNFPAHLPNGHIVPALLAGNTVIFKPSEHAPLTAEVTLAAWEAAGLPPGVLNCLQGGREVGESLATNPEIDGLFFTGSSAGGKSLSVANASHPGKILALEMGGNNPLVAWDARDHAAVAHFAILSAFITAGQRCSCARRLILPIGAEGDAMLEAIIESTRKLRIGLPDDRPEPFMGTLISPQAANSVLQACDELVALGAKPLLPSRRLSASDALLSPGILDVTDIANVPDREIFGPLLQVIRVLDFDAAIAQANRTSYGLCAGILTDNADLHRRFFDEMRAGVINWNRATTGASSALPFGGIGNSGNHRPGGSWAVDYCSYPVASLESAELRVPTATVPGLEG